jgi:dihydrolipoamide dehydrogenase
VSPEVDVIVVGGGAVGENVADYAARGGLTAMIIEAELLGGECSYWACMPSKALLRTGHAVAALRRLPGTSAEFDPLAVLARRDSIAHNWDDSGQVEWAEGAGITVRRGRAR